MGIGVVRILNSSVSQCCRRSGESIKMRLWSVGCYVGISRDLWRILSEAIIYQIISCYPQTMRNSNLGSCSLWLFSSLVCLSGLCPFRFFLFIEFLGL
jgi:hypothetical protein